MDDVLRASTDLPAVERRVLLERIVELEAELRLATRVKSDREEEAVRLLHWREGEIEDAKTALLSACGELSDYDTIVDAAKTAAHNHAALDRRFCESENRRGALQPELTQLIVEARLAAQLLGRGRNRDHARALQLRCDRIASILGGGP